jgi:hypothetical protein
MDFQTFERRFAKLLTAHKHDRENEGCFACETSQACTGSTFCKNSEGLLQCHYCERCKNCKTSAHCTDCTDCAGCTHCEASSRCNASAYLVRSVDCTLCTYCYGCVGLFQKDFYILNEPYEREAYFRMVSVLTRSRQA